MLVKWITCRPTDRAAFGLGQQAWARLHGTPGFLGQGGGWSRETPGVAQIFGFWSDQPSYQSFMDDAHDLIAAAQTGTFDDLRVHVLDQRLGIAHGLPAGLGGASLLRLAHCHVPEHRRDHFIQAQARVWNPGMAASHGMRGGVFAEGAETEFLVLSAWETPADHQRYLDERFHRLRATARPEVDLDAITGDLVNLEPSWTVLG
ncbi:YdbC family protein [Actinoplanes sp. KI2]|uniref:YdbC family protein n=1 Tax=Actinoplanes sp. KI2 TaxID=2983315 RepID=UPI0021D609D1|nr:YdbC family protein [Actinoplanes sp. KI2]MCU7730043.1 YdbC family protein [Actinoplanes sp. KI2]